jgi:Magnesium chelatase, subunit ChlI
LTIPPWPARAPRCARDYQDRISGPLLERIDLHVEVPALRPSICGRSEMATDAAGRLFRSYEGHCKAPGPDTLFETLTAMHSLNDRLKKTVGSDFHGIQEFVALKALRNFAHHQEEVRANVRVIPAPAISDLRVLCLVRGDQVERAIESADKRWRVDTRAACEATFHWYGEAVNINPCLFNLVVRAYETLQQLDVRLPADAVADFEASYRYEEARGLSHTVDGRLTAHAADLNAILSNVVADLPRAQPRPRS